MRRSTVPEGTLENFDFKGPKPRTIGIAALLLILFIILRGTFVIIPAGHRSGL
jgi:hypothetical protein